MLRGHRPYMSGFTASLHSLADLQHDESPPADRAPSVELLALPPLALRVHRKYNSVTLPVSVVYSVTGAARNRQPQLAFVQSKRPTTESMARPRSPQKKHHSSGDQVHIESQLDQNLLAIREKLNLLSTERLQLEHQMDSLTSGIKEACVQCSRRVSIRTGSPSMSLRRVRSIGEAEACGVSPRTPKRINLPRDENDGVASEDAFSVRPRASTTTSRESFRESPNFNQTRHNQLASSFTSDSLASSLSQSSECTSSLCTSSLSSSLPHTVQREKSGSVGSVSVNRESTANLDVFIDDWFSAAIIPELPESPRSLTPSKPFFTSRNLTPSPFNYNRQASTPDLSDRRKFYSSPRIQRVRGSLPEDLFNKVAVHSSSGSLENSSMENLSQVGPCTDQGSPGRTGSTTIIRRSSLTGQLEHVRRPKVIVKRHSSFNVSVSPSFPSNSSLSASAGSNIRDSPRAARARPKSPKPLKYSRQHSVILPGIETCV